MLLKKRTTIYSESTLSPEICPLRVRTKPQPLISQLLSPCFETQHFEASSTSYTGTCLIIIYACAWLCSSLVCKACYLIQSPSWLSSVAWLVAVVGNPCLTKCTGTDSAFHAICFSLPSCLMLISDSLLLLLDDLLLALCGCLLVSTL